MSFRLRVLAMLGLVMFAATAATAWLTLRTASAQMQRSIGADQRDIQLITSELVRHGRDHDTWTGVEGLVSQLAASTGQRIKLVAESGREVADSDVLAGSAPRPVTGVPVVADPRPVLELPVTFEGGTVADTPAGGAVKHGATAISMYHHQRRYKQCLIGAGIQVTTQLGTRGLWEVQPRPVTEVARRCDAQSQVGEQEFKTFYDGVQTCGTLDGIALRDCVRSGFLRQISSVAPEPLHVYIGAAEDEPRRATIAGGPVAMAATIVALIAIAGMFLLSRHVLRPIRALTGAAERLGQGRLTDRVPVSGRDELAALSRAFNRMAQALQDSEERQRRMTADIAHELRTPLTNLRGYLEALTDGTARPSRELFWSLRDEALLQQRIIDDLQDLALAEAGRLTYRRVPVDLAELVKGYPPQHFADGIDIVARAERPAYVDGDLDRLRQAVGNLVRNAIAACGPRGRVELTVVHSGQWIELSVSDTGAGIAESDLPHVFERFWRADRARPRGSGVGLGLAIVRQIVGDHAGTVGVTSRVGEGTSFTIRLPARGSQRAGGPV